MIQLKLKLNSKKPTTVYAVNGKSYLLNPGSNVLNLEYEDYISLAKALGIRPVDNKKNENISQEKEEKPEVKNTQEEPVKEAPAESEKVEDQKPEVKAELSIKESAVEPEKIEEHKEDEASEDKIGSEPVEEAKAKEVDYSTWAFKQLKEKYKEITGENCKLKKDAVISFLQGHQSNA